MISDAPRVWWETITGPQRFANAVVYALKIGNFVVLQLPADFPWRRQFRFSVESLLRDHFDNASFDQIDCEADIVDQDIDSLDVAGYLLSTSHADSVVRDGYRAASGLSIQRYMIDHEVLGNSVTWIKGMRPGQEAKWLEFCAKYPARGIQDGLFVIEVYSEIKSALPKDVFTVLRFDDYVTNYDALLFDSMLVSGMSDKDEWLRYIAAVTSCLCGRDVELSHHLIDRCDFAERKPTDILFELADTPEYRVRAGAPNLPQHHPFSMCRKSDESSLNRLVWRAQLQSLLPLIESERLSLIEKHFKDIKEAIKTPFKSKAPNGSYVMKHDGTRIDDPYEVELGTIEFMLHKKRFSNSKPLFELPCDEDLEHFTMLHTMRNSLAHMNACTPGEVWQFYSTYPYCWQ